MAVTRRSTRQTAPKAPKYNVGSSSSEAEAPKRKPTKPTRQKRARDDDDEDTKSNASVKPQHRNFHPRLISIPSSSPPLKKPARASNPAPAAPSSATNRDANGQQEVFWLLKAEPLPRYENGVNVAFSIDDLRACTAPEPWSGVRNPQARNNMQAMRAGDLGFFYHSNAKPSGVVGVLRIVEEAKVDETAFDAADPYYDAKSRREEPKWFCVGVEFVRKFEEVVDLKTIKGFAGEGGELRELQLVTNSRLSICRVRRDEWEFILGLAGEKEAGEGEGKDASDETAEDVGEAK
jgi:predicted RNA-binding protein with PUA-like domain